MAIDNTTAGIHQSHGCSPLPDVSTNSHSNVEVGLTRGNLSQSSAHSRSGKPDSRQDAKDNRTDWQLNPAVLSQLNQLWRPLQVDFRYTTFSVILWKLECLVEATDAILQLGQPSRLWQSFLVPDLVTSKESGNRESYLYISDCNPFMNNPMLVPNNLAVLHRSPCPLPQSPDLLLRTANMCTFTLKAPIHLVSWHIFGTSLQHRGVSSEAVPSTHQLGLLVM